MSVVAFVRDVNEARAIVTWAGRFAVARDAELVVFFPGQADVVAVPLMTEDAPDELLDPLQQAIQAAVEGIVRTRRARKGRLPRYAVSVRRVVDPDLTTALADRIHVEGAELFVAADVADNGKSKSPSIPHQIASRISCDTVLLYGDSSRSLKGGQVLMATTEGRHDSAAIELAADAARAIKATLTTMCVEACVGDQAIEVGERSLRSILRGLSLEESSMLKVKAVLGDDRTQAIAEEADSYDLVMLGANNESKIQTYLDSTSRPTVAVYRRGPQFAIGGKRTKASTWLPRLNPADYADLYEHLQSGSRWNADFVVMLGLAAGIATLGLLQSSPAVVIGSMLLAPLMTPMIGMGLALNQGNAKLAYSCFRAIGRGFLAGLMISAAIGFVTPGTDLTPEIVARTQPNILDLLIALFSGGAAAYALARPSLAGTIAGVAIATALVPPLCSVGICLAYKFTGEALGAASLLLANVFAIILAAAVTFHAMGLRAFVSQEASRRWVRRVEVGIVFCSLVIAIPLIFTFMRQVHEGRTAPMALSVTTETRQALLKRVQQDKGVTLLLIGRPGIPREEDPVDVGVILSSERPLPRSYAGELAEIVQRTMQNPELNVEVACVAGGWAEPEAGPEPEPEPELEPGPDDVGLAQSD